MTLFQACPPRVWTPPLAEDFVTDGDKLIRVVEHAWRTSETLDGRLKLHQWQKDLIRAALERFPADHPDPELAGRLRYRQLVISIPRQHGKSLLAAIFALYGMLMHERGPYVVGIGSSEKKARIVYDRLRFAIEANAELREKFTKVTKTAGIETGGGTGRYEMVASSSEALQGYPISLGLFDEIHVSKPEMWQAFVNGSVTRRDGLIVGITTAGDDKSELLKTLYGYGEKAAGLDPKWQRFGFYEWSAPDSRMPDNEDELKAFILTSNPSVAEGHLSMSVILTDALVQPPTEFTRYRLNRFVASTSSFLTLQQWGKCRVTERPSFKGVVFAVDQSPGVTAATITASVANPDGTVYTEIVASLVRPTTDKLMAVCSKLIKYNGLFVLDGYSLKGLNEQLKNRGARTQLASSSDIISASSNLYHKVTTGLLQHAGDPVLTVQLPRTTIKNVGENWRITRAHSGHDIDGVMATAVGVYFAQNQMAVTTQLF